MGKILFFESRDERLRPLLQLMSIEGLEITRSRTVDETCYWLQADKLRLVSFDLLLLNELPAKDREREMILSLADECTLPIIFVRHQGRHFEDWFREKMITCHPFELLDCLDLCLGWSENLTKKENTL